MAGEAGLWGLMLVCAAATFAWRGGGWWISRSIGMDGRLVRLLTCIAYATLAALVSRIMVLPVGVLEGTGLGERLVAAAAGLAVFLVLGQNLLAGVITAGVVLVLIAGPIGP